MKKRKQLKFVLNAAVRSDHTLAICFASVLLAFFVIGPTYGSAQRLRNMAGNWSGTYTCAQGVTDLRLAIFQTTASGITAVFKFSPNSTNPNVPSGRYWLSGTYHSRSNSIVLKPSHWIKRPTNYIMVGLAGNVTNENASISGRVLNSGCSNFTVTRN